MNEKQYDLTQGGILRKLLLVAAPIMGTQLMQMAYNLTDMFWLGRVSSDAVAASGSAGMYLWLSMAFMLVARMGAEIGVAQCLGRGDEQKAKGFSQTAFTLGVILGIVFGGAMVLFRNEWIGFFRIQEAHVAKDAADYLAIVGAAVPLTFMTGALGGTFNASGNSRMPFFINTIGLVVNMILDPLFILTWGMGIRGAAVATAIGQAVVCGLFMLATVRGKSRPFTAYRFFARPDPKLLAQIFKWTVPIGLENLLFTFLSMVIGRFIAAWGAQAIAVQRVCSQVESLTWLIGGGFSSALIAFVGQNFGAGKWTRIRRGLHISLLTIASYGVAVTLVMYFGAALLVGLFLPDPEIIALGVDYLHILAIVQIIGCLEAMAIGAFRGVGQTLPPSIVSITGNALRVPLSYRLSTTALGLNGIWWGIAIGAGLRGLVLFLWYLWMLRRQPKEDLPVSAAQ